PATSTSASSRAKTAPPSTATSRCRRRRASPDSSTPAPLGTPHRRQDDRFDVAVGRIHGVVHNPPLELLQENLVTVQLSQPLPPERAVQVEARSRAALRAGVDLRHRRQGG